jgi:hypothetical protein
MTFAPGGYELSKRDIGVLLSAEATEILSLTASANQLRPNLDQLRTTAANINKLLDLLEASGKKPAPHQIKALEKINALEGLTTRLIGEDANSLTFRMAQKSDET